MENFMAGILGIISNATFWGIIIGASFTLTGVHLTNLANDRRLREQLQHDREQKNIQLAHDRDLKNREREMSLRKDIYLAAAEAIHACMTLINRMPQLEISHEKLTEDYMAKSSSMAKVHIVAKETTIKAVLDFSCEVAGTLPRLSAKRQPLLQKMNDILVLSELRKKYIDEQSRLVGLMSQHQLEGSTNQEKFDLLQSNANWTQQRINECSAQQSNLASLLHHERLQFMGECSEETMRLWRLSVPVVTAVRQELDIPLHEGEYGSLVEGAVARVKQVINDLTKQKPETHEDRPATA